MWKTRVCEILGIEYPIIEGGMTMAGNGELAAAVSNAGGLGMIGSNAGWVPAEQREENLRKHIRIAKSATDKPFGVNFTLAGMKELASKLMDVAVEEGVPVAACSGGSPRLYTKRLKDAGLKVIHVLANSSQAKTAEEAGADIVVAEGYEAGGLDSLDELTTLVVVPYVVDVVKIPVVAAGGIFDSRGFLAAMALGAEGVQIGTRFVATHECAVHPDYKQALVNAGDTDSYIIERIRGIRRRALKNKLVNHLMELDLKGAREEMDKLLGPGRVREGTLLGDVEDGELSGGQVSGMIKSIQSAEEVVRSIIEGVDAIMQRCQELRSM